MKPKQLAAFLSLAIKKHEPILILGAPGVGKSDIVSQSAESAGARLIITHPVTADPTDYKGLPFPIDGHAEFLPYGDLRSICEDNGDPRDIIFFIDDAGQAAPAVQASLMQLVQARRVNGHRVLERVTFVMASNRRGDKAAVGGIIEPLKSRYTIVGLEPDLNDWCVWALANGVPAELIAMVRFCGSKKDSVLFDFHPTNDLVNGSCPRTIAAVGRWMSAGVPKELEYEVYSGAAGEAFAVKLLAFLKIYRSLPSPDGVIMAPLQAAVPSDPAVLYAISGALAYRASQSNFPNIIQYANRLPEEFSVLLVVDAIHRDKELMNTRAYIEWAAKHPDIFF